MIHIETITTRLPELEKLWQLKQDAIESYSTAIKLVAEDARCEPAALSAYIAAKMRDKLEKLQIKHEQLSLMLEQAE